MGKTARRSATLDPSSPTSPYLYYESQFTTTSSELSTETTEFDTNTTENNDEDDISSISSLNTTEWLTDDTTLSSPIAQTHTQLFSQIKNDNNNKILSSISSSSSTSFTSTSPNPSTRTSEETTSSTSQTPNPSTSEETTAAPMYKQTSASPSTPTFHTIEIAAASTLRTTPSPMTSTTQKFDNINYLDPTFGRNLSERERLRMEFYATYDVMTGIRIAATLGGFFVLMVFLIVYKSRSHSNKALRDPKIVAEAAAVVEEEEERELQEAIEKTAFSLYQEEIDFAPVEATLQRDRMLSLGNVSCPPMLLNPNMRFSSIGGGGYSSLLEPSSRRFSDSGRLRRKSTSDSSRILSAYHLNDNYNNQNENFFNESDGEEADDEFEQFTTTVDIANSQSFLSVPRGQDSRRSSGMTCCSTESSFLERRCSAITLGLSSLPPVSRGSSRRPSRAEWDGDPQYGPGIHIIEATPKSSPCPSERYMHEKKRAERMKLKHRYDDNSIDSISEYPDETNNNCHTDNYSVNLNNSTHQNLETSSNNHSNIALNNNNNTSCSNNVDMTRRAPLASLSSFKMSSNEFPDSEVYQKSFGSDSVFVESCADTDEDMEQFSTDSDEISLTQTPPPDENVLEQHQLISTNIIDGSFNEKVSNKNKKICDASGASVVVNIDNLSSNFKDDSSLLSSNLEQEMQSQKEQQSYFYEQNRKMQQQKLQQHNRQPQIYKSNSANLYEAQIIIERQQQNDKMTKRPASSGCLISSNFNNKNSSFTNESSISNNNSSSRSNITVLHANSCNINNNSNENSNKSNETHNHSSNVQPTECIEINVLESIDIPSSSSPTSAQQQQQSSQSRSISPQSSNNQNNNSSSVILELPVIATQVDSSSSSQVDPCIPGTSRKWSKETLF